MVISSVIARPNSTNDSSGTSASSSRAPAAGAVKTAALIRASVIVTGRVTVSPWIVHVPALSRSAIGQTLAPERLGALSATGAAEQGDMSVVNRVTLGVRLAAAFAAVVLLLLVVMVAALVSASASSAATTRMGRAQQFVALMKDAKFSAADFNGWQTAYAFDAVRGVAGAAQDNGDSRKAFLASTRKFGATVSAASSLAPADSRGRLQDVTALLTQFMAVDTRIAGLYAAGDARSRQAANALVIGPEIK